MNKLKVSTGLSFALLCSTHAATTAAVADTILLYNGLPNNTAPGDGEANFGGRTELIIGNNGTSPRLGLLRFNVSTFATEINNGQSLTTARIILSERSVRNGNNGSNSTTISVSPLVSQNEGWLEGTRTGSSNNFDTDTVRSVSMSYLGTPSAQNGLDGTRWFGQGGGATVNPPFGAGSSIFQIGTDTAASIGSQAHTFTTSNANETVTIGLDLAALDALLPTWLASGNSNAGVLVETTGSSQLFFGSSESGAGDPAAVLELEFAPVPEPSFALFGLIGALGLIRRCR